jgi:transcriptional regulator with XRE-family HTH domain
LTPRVIKGKIFRNVKQSQRRSTLEALRRARVDAGLTISELAKRAGVSRDTISHAERGRHSPQGPTLSKIARALGRAPSELLAEEERLAPKAESRSSLEPSLLNGLEEERREHRRAAALRDAIADLQRTAVRFEGYHALQKAVDEYRELWEKRLAEGDFDKAALEEAGHAVKVFWPAMRAAADAEMIEGMQWGAQPEETAKHSVLLPAIARFQALCERVNDIYRERYAPAATVYAFPHREAS